MNVGFVLFPNVTQLDFTGPLQVLHRLPGAKTHILAKTPEPVPSDCGLSLVPSGTFADAPKLDLLCVPGGFGVTEAFEDGATLDFVRRAGEGATYVTSVCTGAFILGVAGLLRDRRATTHWAYRHLLPLVGAERVDARVMRDGNVFTAGGVTAGIDFALTVAAEVAGEDVARGIQLSIEYDPHPPFAGGSADTSPAPVVDRVSGLFKPRTETFAQHLQAALA